MKLARASGFRAVVLSAVWEDRARAAADARQLRRAVDAAVAEDVRPVLAIYQLMQLRGAVDAAAAVGIRPVVAVYSFSGVTPLSLEARTQFASFAASIPRSLPQVRDVIVGNEPNLNLFWQPQFDAAGGDQAAVDYEALLASAYDALKDQDGDLNVIGGGLAPHGGDRPSSRPTHSPTQFIRDLGAAYRASGRTKPIMDAFSLHVYGETNRIPPTFRHPLTTTLGIADYPKLVALHAHFALREFTRARHTDPLAEGH